MNAASASRISKFLAKPEVFRGDASNPMVWLHSMERIYNCINFSDEEMIIVLASYFAGPAAVWWNVIKSSVKMWENFDEWWEELENIQQGPNQSIDDIKFRIMELATLLGVPDSAKIRYFMRAINKCIALRVSDINASLSDWSEVTNSAKRIEMNDNKYGDVRQVVESKVPKRVEYQEPVGLRTGGDAASVVSLNSVASTVERLCQGFDALQLQINTNGNSVSGSVRSKTLYALRNLLPWCRIGHRYSEFFFRSQIF
ncbi:uncharacterized protein EV154DRAFT_416411 [Mucor mucedo]|uniref:uncharacterized protein n=1 Tax=Mucor mucedo TaxID=29922 RepID=UPI00222046AA|nr:uncharacterized protein EV154DRAFT_416411 [Mucor mucedo]KAI7893690.1 hypothetical protein EV154DRAFT_416411 [Mucor mucedo]